MCAKYKVNIVKPKIRWAYCIKLNIFFFFASIDTNQREGQTLNWYYRNIIEVALCITIMCYAVLTSSIAITLQRERDRNRESVFSIELSLNKQSKNVHSSHGNY